MTGVVSPFPIFRAFSSTGQPLAGGSLYTYQAGTTTPLATYTDETLGTPNTNPVVLDSTGSAPVWLTQAAYKFVLKDANGVLQWTADQINSQPTTIINVVDYGAVGDGSTDDSPAFIAAANAAGSWGTVIVPRPVASYELDENVTGPCFWILMGGAATSGVGTLGGLTIQQVSGGAINIGGTTFYITSAGKVGIGTASPQEQLDIAGNLNFPYVSGSPSGFVRWNSTGSSASGQIDYGVTTAAHFTFKGAGGLFDFATGSNTYTTIGQNSGVTGFFCTNYANNNPTYWPSYLSNIGGSNIACDGVIEVSNAQNGFSRQSWGLSINTSTNALQIMRNAGNAHNVWSTWATTGIWSMASGSGGGTVLQVSGDVTQSNGPLIQLIDTESTGVSGKIMNFKHLGGEVGSIATTNTATTYNTSSDYRLKEDFKPIQKPLDIVLQLKPYDFKWKASEERTDGFIAHEVEVFAPYAVQGVKDGEHMQQLDYSKLVPILWAAVQDLSAQVKQLQEKTNG